ncbi:MAG TPA: sulfotransferase [Steroidobacteraceae bacterium]|nr:sulfotransferase [Steroidobacteraceae bacterium]
MSAPAEPAGTVEMALTHAARLLESQPAAAAEQANEILRVVPAHPIAQLILGAARRALGDVDGALAVLEPLAKAQPLAAAAHYELGIALGAKGQGEQAIAALRRAVTLKPDMPAAWRALGDHLTAIGDTAGADEAYARSIKYSTRDPRLMEAATHLCDGRLAPAEALLREHLKIYPTDVAAIRMLAEVAARLGRYGDAESLLTRALELAPSFLAARHHLAVVLHRQARFAEALRHLEPILQAEPRNPGYRTLQAAILSRIGDYARAIRLYEEVLSEYPDQAKVWMSYGHALKTAGRQRDCVAAYRRTIALTPSLGEAWWSLANLKRVPFSAEDLEAMRAQLADPRLTDDDRLHFHFAAGKALEDAGRYAESFEHYAQGNAIRAAQIRYDPEENSEQVRRTKAVLTAELLAARRGAGHPAPDPIFIVGLPRSGSTLIEQILASHSAVEGTQELPDIGILASRLAGKKLRSQESRYPEVLATLDVKDFHALGEEYLERTRIQRKTAAPLFIDKMPNNFAHVGLIHLILPNAKIIDARRHPLAAGFSCFKQHFARGQHYTYDLTHLGRYYRDYVELMAHFDAVLPGRVHRIHYENMVADTEGEVRRLLAYCHLPFEDACLRFYENERAVRTASSEQVRTPIYREGLEQWRHYEPWLGPLKEALGPALVSYPAAP